MELIPTDELNLLHRHICQAVGDPTRIQILVALHHKPLNVTTLAETLEAPQSTVSRHLAVLRQRGLVLTQREGTTVTYSLADARIVDALNIMRMVLRDAVSRQSDAIS